MTSLAAIDPSTPTHRYGRPLDDRLPAAGLPPWARAAPDPADRGDAATLATASVPAASADADHISFGDLLDVINPLHHLPVVGPLYREWTGDEIGPVARIAGGGLFGGLIGFAASLVDAAIEELTGDDIGGHVVTALFGGDDTAEPQQPETAVVAAAAATAPATAPAAAAAAAPPPPPPRWTEMKSASKAPANTIPAGTPLTPALSPAAFEALMRSFTGPDAPAAALPSSLPAPLILGAAPATGRRVDMAL